MPSSSTLGSSAALSSQRSLRDNGRELGVFRWGILPLLIAAPAAAQEHNGWRPPTLTNTRYDENWSMPRPPKQPGNWWGLKDVPLGDEAFLTIGMDVRLRYEAYHA